MIEADFENGKNGGFMTDSDAKEGNKKPTDGGGGGGELGLD